MAPSTPAGHPVFAVLYRWLGALGERTGFGERPRRLLAAAVQRVTLPGTRITSPGTQGVARKPG